MVLIIIAFIKLMGAAISGHWDLRDTGTCETMTLLCGLLRWLSGSGPVWQSHKNVTFSPVGHAWLPKWLRPVTVMSVQIIKGEMSIYLILYYTDCVNLGVRGQLRDCSNSVRLIVFFPDPSFKNRLKAND